MPHLTATFVNKTCQPHRGREKGFKKHYGRRSACWPGIKTKATLVNQKLDVGKRTSPMEGQKGKWGPIIRNQPVTRIGEDPAALPCENQA